MKEEIEDNLTTETEKERKIKYKKLKLKLDELQKKKRKYTLFIMVFVMVVISASLLYYRNSYIITSTEVIYSIVVGVLSGLGLGCYIYMILDMKETRYRRDMLEYEVEDIKEEVQDNIFENSIKMSYKYLDQYYLQIREQAQKGFYVTVCVSVFGALLIGFGIILMFMDNTNPSYITCASGVITEFIATVFFYMYNKTVSSMSKYHNKLVLSHNISIALKVADTLPSEDKTKSKNMIIEELLKDMNNHLIKSDFEDKEK